MVVKKSLQAYPNTVREVFELLSWHNEDDAPEVMGSASNKNIKHPADYDLYEVIYKSKSMAIDAFATRCWKIFKKLCLRIKRDKSVLFMDFKCGLGTKGEPLRWTLKEVIQGHKGGTSFADALKEKSRIKVDVVSVIDGRFVEFSNLFSLREGSKMLNEERPPFEETVKADIRELVKEGNYMKALKRQYLLNRSSELEEYFNSDTGLLYRANSDVQVMIEVLGKYNTPTIRQQMAHALDSIKGELQMLPPNLLTKFDNASGAKSKKQLLGRMTRIVNELTKLVNKDTKAWMRRNKIKFST